MVVVVAAIVETAAVAAVVAVVDPLLCIMLWQQWRLCFLFWRPGA